MADPQVDCPTHMTLISIFWYLYLPVEKCNPPGLICFKIGFMCAWRGVEMQTQIAEKGEKPTKTSIFWFRSSCTTTSQVPQLPWS